MKKKFFLLLCTLLFTLLLTSAALAGDASNPCPICGDTEKGFVPRPMDPVSATDHAIACGKCGWFSTTAPHNPSAAPTCTEAQRCLDCNQVLADKNPDNHNGHIDGPLSQAANCGYEGFSGRYQCTECGVITTPGEILPIVGNHVSAGDATCIQAETCSVCKKEIGPKDPNRHIDSVTKLDPVKPTCVDGGYTEGQQCNGCKQIISGHDPIQPTGQHTFDPTLDCRDEEVQCSVCQLYYPNPKPHTPAGDANCVHGETCSVCKKELGQKNPNTHTGEVINLPKQEPTCTVAGKEATQQCAGCNVILSGGGVIAPTGIHVFDPSLTCEKDKIPCTQCQVLFANPKPHTPAHDGTCISKETCAVCHKTIGELDPDFHAPSSTVIPGIAATCTSSGLTEGETCDGCGQWIVTPQDIAPLPHVPGAEATCTHPQACEVCGTVLAGKLPHAYGPYVFDGEGLDIATCAVCEHTKSATCYRNDASFALTLLDNNISMCPLCGAMGDKTAEVLPREAITVTGAAPTTAALHVHMLRAPFDGASLAITLCYERRGKTVEMDSLTVSIAMEEPQGKMMALMSGELVEIPYVYENGVLTFDALGAMVFCFI